MQKIVLASNNQGKIDEFTKLFAGFECEIIPQSELNIPDIEETGLTFVENAMLKARHASKIAGLPAIADDSGLVIDALNGAPGIYSARYAGKHNDMPANIAKIFKQLAGVEDKNRSARFVCCLVLMHHFDDPLPLICFGTLEGKITTEPAGNNGFGYDPILYLEEYQCTVAQLDKAVKNSISHRARAMQQLLHGNNLFT